MGKLSDNRLRTSHQGRMLQMILDNEYPRRHSYQTSTPETETDYVQRNITETKSNTSCSIFHQQGKPLNSQLAFQQLEPDGTCTKKKSPINDQSIRCVTSYAYIEACLFCKQHVGSTTKAIPPTKQIELLRNLPAAKEMY